MLIYENDIVREVEEDVTISERSSAIRALRKLGLYDFGSLLMSMPNAAFPKLSSLLPAMAPAETQRAWTGNDGEALLSQTTDFVRSVAYNYAHITGGSLADLNILDYGCGWGRISRLMYYFTEERTFFGVDPWHKSIEECNKCGLTCNFMQSDYLPTTLPVGGIKFDLIYAFSVFTHLSLRSTIASVETIRRYIKPNGIFVVTIRPVEYWDLIPNLIGGDGVEACKKAHRSAGFAFVSHAREAVDGDVTYGETSMSFEWIEANMHGWTISAIDRSASDPYQLYVFLRPA